MLKWRVTPYSELLRPCIYIHYCVYCRFSEGSLLHGDSEDPASFCALVQACKHGLRRWGALWRSVWYRSPSHPVLVQAKCEMFPDSRLKLKLVFRECWSPPVSSICSSTLGWICASELEAAGVKLPQDLVKWVTLAEWTGGSVWHQQQCWHGTKPLRRKRVPVGEGRSGIWLGSPPGCLTMKVFWACLSRVRTRWRDYTSHMALERLGIPQEGLEYVARGGRGMSGIPSLWGSSETVRSFY